MTIKEKITSYLGFMPKDEAIASALQDAGVTGSLNDEYEDNSANLYAIKKALLSLVDVLITTPNTTNSVTGYTIGYNLNALIRLQSRLRKELGIEDVLQPSIYSPKVW